MGAQLELLAATPYPYEGERRMVMISFSVGSGIGPDMLAPITFVASTIFSQEASIKLWS